MKYQHHEKFQTYQSSMQYVCFDCRKGFKKYVDMLTESEKKQACPQCGENMYMAGIAFKAPKKEDKKQWDKVKLLILNEFVFYRDSEIEVPLKTPREALEFLERHKDTQVNKDKLKNRKSLIDRKKTSKKS